MILGGFQHSKSWIMTNTLKTQKFLDQEAFRTDWKEETCKSLFPQSEWMSIFRCVSCVPSSALSFILKMEKKYECNPKLVQIKTSHLCKAACILMRSPGLSYLGAAPRLSCKSGQICIPCAKWTLHEAQLDDNLRMFQKLQQIIFFQ